MSFVPWPGFGPFECYDADQTVARRRDARARRLRHRRALHARPQPGPRHLLDRRRAGAVLRRRAVPGLGRPHRPARRRLRRRCSRSIATLVDALPAETIVYPGHMGDHHARPRARDEPVPAASSPRSGEPEKLQAPRGTFDVLPEQAARARGARARARARILERRGLPAHRDADVRGDRAVRARRGRGHRHRAEGDVHVRRRRRALADAAARGHRAGLPRLPRARHAQAARSR